MIVALVLAGLAAGLDAVGAGRWTQPAGTPIRFALVQGNVPQDRKWLPQMRGPTLERYVTMSEPYLGVDLVIWPETALPAARHQLDGFIEGLHAAAAAAGSAVLFGLPEVDGEPRRAYNSVLMVGASTGRYRKRHLVPFGEYLPADPVLRPVTRALGIPVSNFAPGEPRQPLLAAAGHLLAVFICYEIAFGNEVIEALPEAELLVTVSNDAWFRDSLGPHQHLQMARARALETGRAILRATNTGITAAIEADGSVPGSLDPFRAAVLTGSATPRRGATPYVRAGDGPVLGTAVLLLLPCAAVWWHRRHPGHRVGRGRCA